ncbi:hypothetical protein LLH00_02475 [bacterium]|nr:hypothetical protein [bacterium]
MSCRHYGNTIVFMAIIILALSLYITNISPNILSSDEYRGVGRYLTTTVFNLVPDKFSAVGLWDWFRENNQIYYSSEHGVSLGIAYSLFYRILGFLGVPITKWIFHLFSGVFSAITAFLFYRLLIKEGFNLRQSLFGALMLILAPIYFHASRIAVGIIITNNVFDQVIGLLILTNFISNKESLRKYQWILGLFFTHVVLSENLFFLTITVLLTSFILRDSASLKLLASAKGRETLFESNIKPLLSWRIWGLPLAVFIHMAIFTALTYLNMNGIKYLADGYETGFYYTPIIAALRHNSALQFGFDINKQYINLTMLMGEWFFIFFPIVLIASFYLSMKKRIESMPWSFALMAGSGYICLWYFFSDNVSGSYALAAHYQIMLLLPMLIMSLHLIRYVESAAGNSLIFSTAIYAIIISSTILTDSVVVYNKGRLLFSYFDNKNFKFLNTQAFVGAVTVNNGSKASGFILRQLFEYARLNPSIRKVNIVYNKVDDLGSINIGARIYANLYFLESGFKWKYGLIKSEQATLSSGLQYVPEMNSLVYKHQSIPLADEADYSELIVDFSDSPPLAMNIADSRGYYVYKIISCDGKLKSIIHAGPPDKLVGISGTAIPPGSYYIKDLDKSYNTTYNKLEDYYLRVFVQHQ